MLVPIRSLGKNGVNTDVDPFSLPPETFTMAVNARFRDEKIERGPLFKQVGPVGLSALPRFTLPFLDSGSAPHVIMGHDDGTISDWASTGNGTSNPKVATPSGLTTAPTQAPWTGCVFNNVAYVNRSDQVPFYRTLNGTTFAAMPNGWDSTWRAGALRSCAGVLVAINIQKGGTSYPTMVKTSDYSTFGSPPNAWVGAASNSASENILAMISEPLIDGWPMRDSLMLYTAHQTVLMEPTYSSTIFAYKLLFANRGAINQNCVADVDNLHYVFGSDDLWVHDGFNPKSVASGRVKRFVYQNMVSSQRWQFFAVHNPRLEEVMFCFVSRDQWAAFPAVVNGNYPGCNRAAVYNYRADTWYFYDLPYVTHACVGPPLVGVSYDGMGTTTFSQVAGTYSSFMDTDKFALMTVTQPVTSTRGSIPSYVRTLELYDSVSATGLNDSVATADVFLENSCIDLDHVSSEIRGYKVVRSIYPQGRFSDQTTPLTFTFGSADYANFPSPTYGSPVTFDGSSQYKLDYMTSGRFLSLRVAFSSPVASFTFSGLDLDMTITGHR